MLAACAYEPPVDPEAPPPASVLAGEVVVDGVEVPGDVVVLAFDAADPPPPSGTGMPLTFATVPAHAFSEPGAGLLAAPWTLTGLPAGDYLLTAVMDLDGDFNPFDPVTAGATCGDVAGAHVVDLAGGQPAVVSLPASTRIDDVSIVVGRPVPLERPAFTVTGTVSRAASLDPTTPQTFLLTATAVHSALADDLPVDLTGPCPPLGDQPLCDPAALSPCDTALWVEVVDANADGVPDLRTDLPPEAAIPDVWPRVYLTLLDPPEGQAWSAEAIPLLAELGAMQLGAPAPVPFGTPVPMASTSVTWLPVARRIRDGEETTWDLRTSAPDAIPAGAWAVTVVLRSGQTWTVPNILGALGVTTQPDVFDPAGQSGRLLLE
jgi:hypothetical protein